MDPYEVLGVSYNSSWKDIRKSYKIMLHKTHPDKMGNSNFFNMIKSAYDDIKSQFEEQNRQSNYPKNKQKYKELYSNKKKNKINDSNFNLEQFNTMFEQYANLYNKNNPYMNGGYNINKSLDYQEDIEQLKSTNISIPKLDVIIYKEPEAMNSNSSLLDNVFELGITKITDYSCNRGTDYMRAYSEESEIIDNRHVYKNIDEIQKARLNQNFELTEKDKKKQEKLKLKKEKLEQLRRNNLKKNDNYNTNIYNYIQNRIK